MLCHLLTLVLCISTSIAYGANTTCNGYASLCTKLYSNVTFIGAHNTAAVGTSMVDNQHYGVATQLADGIRLLQGQGHNDSTSTSGSGIKLCHSSCSLQDGGTLEKYLTKVKTWVTANPNEVITLLWVNSDSLPASQWAKAYDSAGLVSHSYAPAADKVTAWPTMQSLIDSGTTVINFITSQADHSVAPYLLGEWQNIWETPYENTNYKNFTCELDRGTRPNLLYMANHFAYSQTTFLGATIDSPDTDNIGSTNSKSSVLAHGDLCMSSNSRYPNFFLVDFYEKGSGGALQAAADMNGVTYVSKTLGTGSVSAIATFFGGQNQIRNIAIVVSVGVAVMILAWIAICCCCRRKTRRRKGSMDEHLIKTTGLPLSAMTQPTSVRTFANRLSQQPAYAPVGEDREALVPPSFNQRSRTGSSASLASSQIAFSDIRGSGRPLPTKPVHSFGYSSYDNIKDSFHDYNSRVHNYNSQDEWQRRQ